MKATETSIRTSALIGTFAEAVAFTSTEYATVFQTDKHIDIPYGGMV